MSNNSLKIVIFDLDGTLVDAYSAVTASLNYAFGQLDYPILDLETVKRNVGWGERKLLQRFVKEEDLEKVHSIYRQHHPAALKSGVRFLPGAKELLSNLKSQGLTLAIASNRPTRFTEIILKHLKVRDHFSHVLCADKVENPKPAPDLLEQILKQAGLSREQALFVGDMVIDVETGQAAGVKMIAVTTGSSTRAEIEALAPHKVVDNIEDIQDHFC